MDGRGGRVRRLRGQQRRAGRGEESYRGQSGEAPHRGTFRSRVGVQGANIRAKRPYGTPDGRRISAAWVYEVFCFAMISLLIFV